MYKSSKRWFLLGKIWLVAGIILATLTKEDVCGFGLMLLLLTAVYGLVFYSILKAAGKFTKLNLLAAIILTLIIIWVTGGILLLLSAGAVTPTCYGHSFSL